MPYTLLLLTATLMWSSTSLQALVSTGLTRTMTAKHVWTWLLKDRSTTWWSIYSNLDLLNDIDHIK